ncbi:hypothetical protein C3743_02175 [Burkholderia contaminans]|uniref:Uncharacterized protein n=1 Tax=Burkholderia contaminans TaxID=488447 RepID=A0A2S5E272_9BURK|nr:hypothetical protein C3743_02175 [Burkholderia contaminans]
MANDMSRIEASSDNIARFEAKGGAHRALHADARPWARTTGRRPGVDSNLRNAAAAWPDTQP